MALTQISTDGIKNGTITGSDLATNVDLVDNQKLRLGTVNDLEIYHDGSNSYLINLTGDLTLQNGSGNTNQIRIRGQNAEESIVANGNGSVDLYYDNSKKFETTSSGVAITGGLTADGTSEFTANVKFDGGTAGRDITFLRSSNKLRFQDNTTFSLGDDDDFSAFHDGSKTRFINDTGNLELQSDNYIFRDKDNGDLMMKLLHDGAVELYYDHVKKLETTSLGVQLTDGHIFLNDNYYLSAGTGNDLKIYHDGTNSFIDGGNTHALKILSLNFRVRSSADNENILNGVEGGAVELYYDGNKKLETTSGGVTVTGSVICDTNFRGADNVKLSLGDAQDLEIDHDGTNNDINYSNGNLLIRQGSHSSSQCLQFDGNGHLYVPDNEKIYFGASADLQIYHDGSNSFIKDAGTGNLKVVASVFQVRNAADNETMIEAHDNGQVEIYHNDSKVFNTEINGVRVNGGEGGPAILYMYSDEGDDLADKWKVEVNDTASDYTIYSLNNSSSWETSIRCVRDAKTELYYNNGKKLETYSGGVLVTGELRADDDIRIQSSYPRLYLTDTDNNNDYSLINNNGNFLIYDDTANEFRMRIDGTTGSATMHWIPTNNNTYDLGSSSYKWRNIYTNDLHLSNEGHSNDVDGTWGNWTIQEGESDLFLKNNRSGKKYKFNLTEVA